MGDAYTPIQNRQAFDFVDCLLEAEEGAQSAGFFKRPGRRGKPGIPELAEGAAVGLPLNAPARSQVRATGRTHMRALTIWHRKRDGETWEVLADNLTGRPTLFFGYEVALVYALRSSDQRLRYQFMIEGGTDGNGKL